MKCRRTCWVETGASLPQPKLAVDREPKRRAGKQATKELKDQFATAGASSLALLLSFRFDLPTEWAAFAGGVGDFRFLLRREHFPYMAQRTSLSIDALEMYGVVASKLLRRSPTLALPAMLAAELVTEGSSELTFTPDAAVLKRDPKAQVFLLVRYSF